MRVGIDAEQASQFERALAPAPIHIKPPRMRVNLDGNAVFGAGLQDALHIDLVAGTPQELPSGDVAENGRAGILDRPDDAVSLLLAAHPEIAVHAGDDKIK